MEQLVKLGKLHKLDSTATDVLKILAEELGEDERYISYTEIAKRLSLSRNCVKYAVERMIARGTITCRNGKLSVQGTIVTLKERG